MSINPRVASIEQQVFARWVRIANDVVGTLSFTLAIACISTESPRFFAVLSMAFVLAAGYRLQRPYQRVYRLWREVNHPLLQSRLVWRHFGLFIAGWIFLGLVALGIVNTKGLSVPLWL